MADYRDELSAAHARISDLEDKVRGLEAEIERPDPGTAIRLPELEAEVERAAAPADAKRRARKVLILQLTGAALAVASAAFSFFNLPLVAAFISAAFLATVVASLVLQFRLEPAKRRLAEATERLADARRMHTLERRVAAAEARTRVELGTREPDAEDELAAPTPADPRERERNRF